MHTSVKEMDFNTVVGVLVYHLKCRYIKKNLLSVKLVSRAHLYRNISLNAVNGIKDLFCCFRHRMHRRKNELSQNYNATNIQKEAQCFLLLHFDKH